MCVGGTQAEAGARRPEEGAWPRRLRPGDAGDTVGSLLPGAGGAAMLLSGGDPPAQEWFMVQTKSKPRVQRQRQQVQRIFRVKLNAFQSRPDTPYFWLQLEGPRENMGKAKVNSVWPLITSSQTFLPPFAPLPSPLPPKPGRQGSPEAPRPGLGSMAGRYWAIPCLSTSAALGPSLWFLLSFLPHPSLACHFSPSSVLRKALRCASPQEPSLTRARIYSLFLHRGSNLRSGISVACAAYLFVLHPEAGRPRSFCLHVSLLKSWAAPRSLSAGTGGAIRDFAREMLAFYR